MTTSPRFQLGHRKCLDGVRGLAVLVVLIFHLPLRPITGGIVGVDLFFVLSGFLITSLLLEEWRQQSTISLGRFYMRRALRLLPALVLVLVASLILSAVLESKQEQEDTRRMAGFVIGYIANYSRHFGIPNNPFLGPTWSLSIEEHYYLLWPFALLLMLRARWPKGIVAGILVLLMLSSAGLRAYYWLHDGMDDRAYFYTPARLDGVLMGSFTALLLSWGCAPKTSTSALFLKLGGFVSMVFFCSFAVNGSQGTGYYLGGLALNAGMAVLISSLLLTPLKPVVALFESRVLMFLGTISYGLYLWHPCVYALVATFNKVRMEYRWLLCLPLTLLVSVLSYLLVERPLLRLKARFHPRGSPGNLPSRPSPAEPGQLQSGS